MTCYYGSGNDDGGAYREPECGSCRGLTKQVRELRAKLAALEAKERDVWSNPETWKRWCDARILEDNEHLEGELSVLRDLIAKREG